MVLPESGRIHAFGDTKNYFDFLAHGEVLLTRTRIGEGPGGRTLVYGITADDVKTNRPSLGEQVMGGSLAPAADWLPSQPRYRALVTGGHAVAG